MLKSHEKFHSTNGKRQVLVVDDELINRELMGLALESDYEVLFAEDGLQAMEMISRHRDTLSLVLLDLMMPTMSGKEVLRRIKADTSTRHIPVIVLTADQKAEVETLGLGAADFIPKPYPEVEVILARILRTIELSEDRQIIQSTERDPLTGLYNREFFYRYAEQFDHHHKALAMDAIVVDVNHFHMINERFGTAYGDDVLRHVGERLRAMVSDTDGIVCRREADTFMVYCPHGKDYKAILERASIGLAGDDSINNRVRLRMGVYPNADKDMDIERRFDRAKMAADTVRNSFTKTIGIYDKTLHDHELYAEQLIEDFPAAIREGQFVVHYQPKFDIRPDTPVLASAEALIRWQHPALGMISPGVFIPLFEENGLVQKLDTYVWESAARQIRAWKDAFDFSVPVSVNVSRVDMYDPALTDTLRRILDENSLTPSDLLLEITESAYTQDSQQIINTVNTLRSMGFRIEMDDFGTGYSSLNMISTLPIDVLKLDMQFIRTAFSDHRDTRMIEVIIDIADYLGVPVIAEGVETEEQLQALRTMGCDIVQGYYFSRPVPPGEYERFVAERGEQVIREDGVSKAHKRAATDARRYDGTYDKVTFARVAQALAEDCLSLFYVNLETNAYLEYGSPDGRRRPGVSRHGEDFFETFRADLASLAHPDDLPRLLALFTRDNILREIDENGRLTASYRLQLGERTTHVHLKARCTRAEGATFLVVGISDIDAEMAREQEPS